MAEQFTLALTMTQQFPPNDLAPEQIRHVLYGSKRAIQRTIDILHIKRYAERFEWTQPLPTQTPGEYMSILSRRIRIDP